MHQSMDRFWTTSPLKMARYRIHHVNLKLCLQVFTCSMAGIVLCVLLHTRIYLGADTDTLSICRYSQTDNDGALSSGNDPANAGYVPNTNYQYHQQRQSIMYDKTLGEQTPFSINVTNSRINLFEVTLPPTLPNYRNPCWIEPVPENFSNFNSYFAECLYVKSKIHDRIPKFGIRRAFSEIQETIVQRRLLGKSWRIRCFPYLFIIGVAKSGTTALFHSMEEYVHHFVPATLKELHFWEFKREANFGLKNDCGADRLPTFAEYLDMFDNAAETIRMSMETRDGVDYHPYFTGEATPTTLTSDFNWKKRPGNVGLESPKYLTAHYLYQLAPHNLFIVIMRDPVDRLFSNFRMKLQYNVERNISRFSPDMFPNLVKEGIENFKNCTSFLSVRGCAYIDEGFDFEHIMIKSFYHIFIRDWLDVYPREQFLFLRMEDYKYQHLDTMRRVVEFLKSTPLTPEEEEKLKQEQKVYLEEEESKQILEMDAESRKTLQDFYRPHNKQLVSLLNDDKYSWGY